MLLTHNELSMMNQNQQKDIALKILRPSIPRIISCIHAGYATIKQCPPFEHKRTLASVASDYIHQNLEREFNHDENVRVHKENGTIKLVTSAKRKTDYIVVRFKKATRGSGLGSNIPTQAELDFRADSQQCLFGLPEEIKLECTWTVDPIMIASIQIVSRDHDDVVWSETVWRRDQGRPPEPLPPRSEPSNPSSLVSVKAKKKKSADGKKS